MWQLGHLVSGSLHTLRKGQVVTNGEAGPGNVSITEHVGVLGPEHCISHTLAHPVLVAASVKIGHETDEDKHG